MKFSFNWLKEYVDIDVSPEQLAEKLTLAGHEVEGITKAGEKLKGIITAQIQKIEPHPNADKLCITSVYDGKTTHQIVTGADNVFEGAVVPVSLPGAVLANGIKMKKARLRSVDSYGMLCSEVELGVSDSSDGIWILPDNTPVGVDFIEFAKLQDTVLDIAVLPNRGDCQSIFGLAREISVIFDRPLKLPTSDIQEVDGACSFDIEIKKPDLCPEYTGRIIRNVKNNNTPLWMQRCLYVSGIRPLGLIIDITNYVLLELGQPLHAFDHNKIYGNKIIVKTAGKGEKFKTLDNEERDLDEDILMICDDKRSIAIAGIMGGNNSEIDENTTDVLLESAYFKPSNIRKSEMKLGLRTESVVRFEKGVDIDKVVFASCRASYLFQELAEGQVMRGLKIKNNKKNTVFTPKRIAFSAEKINGLLGSDFSRQEMLDVLTDLGFIVENDNDDTIVTVPTWRQFDVNEWPCLAEEVARIKGLSHIKATLPYAGLIVDQADKEKQLSDQVADSFISNGFFQVNTFPMISEKDLEILGITLQNKSNITIANPINTEESIMRPDLLPSILKVLSFNIKRQVEDIKIFEIDKKFDPGAVNNEKKQCVALVTGKIRDVVYTGEDKKVNDIDIFYLKGLVENIIEGAGFCYAGFEFSDSSYLHPKKSMAILSGAAVIGKLGFIRPDIAEKYDIEKPVGYICLEISGLARQEKRKKIHSPVSRFPSTRRDISLLLPDNINYSDVEHVIEKHRPDNVRDFFLFDSFQSEKIGMDNKSLALGFIYQNNERTLSDEEVNREHKQLCRFITDELPVKIR
ncbi:MAG: phenylalanine--tRNA ligase subunit beta [bacterium]|nr:phenylalanine--tRNA ligase subunit beta [bacterium]